MLLLMDDQNLLEPLIRKRQVMFHGKLFNKTPQPAEVHVGEVLDLGFIVTTRLEHNEYARLVLYGLLYDLRLVLNDLRHAS